MRNEWKLQIIYALLLAVIVCGVSLSGSIPTKDLRVNASAVVSDNQYDNNSFAGATITIVDPSVLKSLSIGGSPYITWSACSLGNPGGASGNDTIETAGWYCYTFNQWAQYKSIVGYNLSFIPASSQILKVRILSHEYSVYNPAAPTDWKGSYFTWYKTLNTDHHTITGYDWELSRTQGNIAAFQYKSAASFPTSNVTPINWSMYSGYLSQVLSWRDTSNYLWFTFSSQRSVLNVQPDVYVDKYMQIQNNGNATQIPRLEITYISTPPVRLVYTDNNAAINTLTTGNETSYNITWGSPRCAFADELIYFKVNGDSGANVTLKCIGIDGTLLASQISSVRIDGVYNWSFTVPSNYSGWVRAYEENSGIYSTWGYIDRAPSPTMLNLTTYAYDTAYPQYDNPFRSYAVWKDDLMFIYWATNIGASELDTYNLALWTSGNSTYGTLFDHTTNWLNDNYYSVNKTANRYLAANRYAIFSPQIISSGFNTGDGLVINLNREYDLSGSGFIVPAFYNNGTGEVITTCHTAYYYLQNWETDGVKISVDQFVEANKVIGVYIDVGIYSKIPDRLSGLNVQLIDNLGYVYNSATGSIVAGVPLVAGLQAPATGGYYQVRCTFADASISPYYSLVLDFPLSVTGPVSPTATTAPGVLPGGGGTQVKDWTDWVKSIIKKNGLDNEAGHWLVIFIICIIWVILLRKHSLAMTAMIILTIGAALIMKWLNPWFYVLLALGAGVIIFGTFKKKTHTGDEG